MLEMVVKNWEGLHAISHNNDDIIWIKPYFMSYSVNLQASNQRMAPKRLCDPLHHKDKYEGQ